MPKKFKAFLFDLDGTLVDTAQDIAQALNQLLISESKKPLPFASIRPVVSDGIGGLLKLGLGLLPGNPDYDKRYQEMLIYCQKSDLSRTVLFKGMDRVLNLIQQKNKHWGIVTNKTKALTYPLLEKLGLNPSFGCIVCGDTLAQKKPDPAPLLYAADLLNTEPDNCCYIGDARRDIIAAQGAGMFSFVALYGYISPGEDPFSWQADSVIQDPENLIRFI